MIESAPTYKIEAFEGPLDLLLNLIEKNKMEIANIEISVILEQYTEYLSRMKHMDMEIAGEFIVMASELMLIKSKMLLPRQETEEEEDPRERLALALLEYKKAKQEAQYLEAQYSLYSRRFVKDSDEIPTESGEIAEHSIALLKQALQRMFSKKEKERVGGEEQMITPILARTVVPVDRMIAKLDTVLKAGTLTPLDALFSESVSRSETVAVFLALLALVKDGYLLIESRLGDAITNDGETDGFEIELYCQKNPEQPIPADYADAYRGLEA